MEFVLGSVTYETPPGPPTLERATWLGKWQRKAGLHDLSALPKVETEADAQRFYKELAGRAFEHEAVAQLLAGGLQVKGEPWSKAQAERTVLQLASVDGLQAIDALCYVLLDFLVSEPALFRTLLRYSRPASGLGVDASSLPGSPAANSNPVPTSPMLTMSGVPSPGDSQAGTLVATPS